MRSAIAACLLVGCGSSEPSERPIEFGGDRPATLKVPSVLDEGRAYPLVLVLHGYGFAGFAQAGLFQLSNLPSDNEALLIAPDGTVDSTNKQFWNADPACCDFFGANPDDVGYLSTLVEDVSAAWPVDQVFVVGHSNGAFMGYRLACERADLIAASALLAGNTSLDTADCAPSEPTSILLMHGTSDVVVPFDGSPPSGSPLMSGTAGAIESRERWSQYNGCGSAQSSDSMELDQSIPGDNETEVQITTGCPENIGVELWTHENVGHVPAYNSTFGSQLWTWLLDHAR